MNKSGDTFDRSIAPTRMQSVYGIPREVIDVSEYFPERKSISQPDLDVIDIEGLLGPDEVAIGIGKPNLFTLIPNYDKDEGEEDEHLRFAAKSVRRAPSKLEHTKGRIQSGVFFILTDRTREQIDRILYSARKHEGGKNLTCVNANMNVLADAGITLGSGDTLSRLYFPLPAFSAIQEQGLMMDGEEIPIQVIKTTDKYLERQAWETTKATVLTLCRHAKRALSSGDKTPIQKKMESPILPRVDTRTLKPHPDHLNDFTVSVSNTSRIAVPLRLLWGPHSIFSISQDRVDIDNFLPDVLTPYPDEKPSFSTRMKKNVLFNDSVVGAINRFMQKGFSDFPDKSESELHNMFEIHTEEKPNKYNIISSLSGTMLAKTQVQSKIVDWILTKHVLVSNYNKSVRFAGEIRKDEEGIIWVNNNSGTYKPSVEQLNAFVKYLSEVFPHVTFKADYQI